MKIRQPTNREDADTKSQVNRNNRSTGFAADEAGEHQTTRPVERDFASVLRQSVKPSRERFDDADDGKEDRRTSSRRDEKSSASERESAVERREQEDESGGQGGENSSGGGNFNGRGGVADVMPHAGNMDARQILHVADLERIVAAVRTKLIADNRREVTIQLHRSVLAGLRVKVSQNESGHVTAEFIVASEAVRSQIEGRAPELAELLRGRGINIAHIKTSLGEEAGGGASDDGRSNGEGREAVAARSVGLLDSPPVAAGETGFAADSTDASTPMPDREQTTRYRA